MTAYEWVVAYLAATGSGRIGSEWQCPAHDDATPSLSVNPGHNGAALIYCHAGCDFADVMAGLGLPWRVTRDELTVTPHHWLSLLEQPPTYPRLVPPAGHSGHARRTDVVAVTNHVYLHDQVRLVRRRYSDGGKSLSWERRLGRDWYSQLGSMRLADLPLYRRDYITQAKALHEPIVLCESESSVDALIDAGIYATTWAGGAGDPKLDTLARTLAGLPVIWIPDNDAAGLSCSRKITDALAGHCDLHTVVPSHGLDARDLLEQLGSDGLRSRLYAQLHHEGSAA